MPIPLTFSAPGEEFEKAVEDALRYAVWLAHWSDNLMQRRYRFDRNNPVAGTRIRQTWNNRDISDGLTTLKQCVIEHSFPDSIYDFKTSQQGVKKVIIGARHLFPYDTRHASNDVESDEETANAVAQRSERIFMRGTLYQIEQDTNRGILIDPFHSPLFTAEDAPSEDLIGAYDPDRAVYLNDAPPKISRRTERISRRRIDENEDVFQLPPGVWMVSYGVFAEYEVQITDFETMSAGGSLG